MRSVVSPPLGTPATTYAATALHPLRTLDAVAASRRRLYFARRNVNGVRTVFAVIAERVDASCAPIAYRVRLPVRPNGSTGWVRAVDVRLTTVHSRIAIDLSQRRITLFRDGRPILVVSAAVGSSATPTPTGRFS